MKVLPSGVAVVFERRETAVGGVSILIRFPLGALFQRGAAPGWRAP